MVRFLTLQEQETGIETRHKECFSTRKKPNICKEMAIKLIKEIVKKTLIELAVSLLFAGVGCLFVATPMGMATLLIAAVAVVAINILIRSIGAYCWYRLFQLQYNNSPKAQAKKVLFESTFSLMNTLAPTTFSTLVDSQTRGLIVHEGGHALAATLLIKDPQVRIKINPFQGGVTSYNTWPLTRLGELFGRENSKLLIAAAGPLFSVITATTCFGASLALGKSHPELSRYLKMTSLDCIAQHAFYAFSALGTAASEKSHDFVNLMGAGLHPLAAVVSIIALPILVKLGFFIYDKVKEKIAEAAMIRESQHKYKNYKIKLSPQKGFLE